MKTISLLLSALCLFISCSRLPRVYPVEGPVVAELHQKCRSPFPVGKWQFLHSIEATLPGGEKSLMLGVTIISSQDRTARCVIMTIEGLVVFDVRYDGQVVINRGIPPFDSRDFAEGLIRDIQFMFFAPEGPRIEFGIQEDGSSVCRHQNPDGSIVDIVTHPDNRWELRQYGRHFHPARSVIADPGKTTTHSDPPAIPDRLELTVYGIPGYALVMDLVEAVPLNPEASIPGKNKNSD